MPPPPPPLSLLAFNNLNSSTWYYHYSTPSSSGPSLILLLAWMDASPKHISKYASRYRTIYPHSSILVLTTSALNAAFHSRATNRTRLAPALEVLTSQTADATILLHLFSNGGAITACHLLRMYKEKTGRCLPVQATMLDSSPGIPTYVSAVRAFSVNLPNNIILRLLGGLLLKIIFVLYVTAFALLGKEERVVKTRGELNDVSLMQKGGRLYIYSEADQMVDWRDVEAHSREAEGLGYIVEREKFEGSGHAGHMLKDSERYWEGVRRVWGESVGKTGAIRETTSKSSTSGDIAR